LIRFLIKIQENFYIAINALKENKMRSVLTTLGIIIGVLTVISVSSIITGLNEAFKDQISALGSNTLYIGKYPWMSGMDWFKYRNRPDITVKDADYIKEHLKLKALVSPLTATRRNIKFKDNDLTDIVIRSATIETERVDDVSIDDGRFFTAMEINRRQNKAIIGYEIYDKLFHGRNALNKRVWIDGIAFTVIGTTEKKGSIMGHNLDSEVYIPIGSLFKNYGFHRSVDIKVKVPDHSQMDAVKEELTFLMRISRGLKPREEDNFSINQQEILKDTYDKLTKGLYTAAFGISALSLLVGGIGIMNIMLVSVAERKREIGIRKALGATRGLILFQFLIESIIICGIGGAIAIGLSYLVSMVIDKTTPFPAAVPIWSIFMGLGFSSFVGLFFGIYPARKAAKLNPIECLHYE